MWLHGTQPCRRELALGKQIGEYSGKLTSLTWEDGPGTATTSHGNIEGTVTGELGEGTYALTQMAVAEAGAQSGTWSQVGFVGMQDGTGVSFRANGTWEATGANKWRYRGTGHLSDGGSYATEFEGEWATRTWAGKLYEWS